MHQRRKQFLMFQLHQLFLYRLMHLLGLGLLILLDCYLVENLGLI